MKKLFLFAFSAMLICACSESGTDQNSNEDYIRFSQYNLSFDGSEETQSIQVYSSGYWTLTDGASWCVPSHTRGVGGDIVTFTALANNSNQERNTTFIFICGNLSQKLYVTQQIKGALTISTPKIEMEATGGEAVIEIKADIDYSYEIDSKCKDWITYKETRAIQTSRLVFNVASNINKEKREGKITIRGKEQSETVTIYQAGLSTSTITVHVPKKGTLQAVLKEMELNIEAIGSLKITGELNDEDFISIRLMTNLKNLDISEVNITALPTRAFHASENVENLILPNTLTTIGSKMFAESTLKFVIIPVGVTTIEQAAFEKCTALTSIEIPASVETIGDSAFMGCSKLATVTFEKGSQLKTIGGRYGSGAFANCTALTAIEIPASVETIEATAFKRCSSLATVTFEKGSQLKTIGGEYSSSSYYGAFSDCSSLTSIEIPASVETIEATAFKRCSSLATVTFEKGSQLKTIGGEYSSSSYYGAFSDCSSLTSIEIPASVETIEATAFKRCSSLATVTFEKGSQLKTIGGGYSSSSYYGAFSDCSSLTSIEIPASVETIEATAFKRCSSLATVTFEKGSQLKTIGGGYYYSAYEKSYYSHGAFSDCIALASIEIPASVETIEAAAFAFCSSLKTVTFEKGSKLTTIGGGWEADFGAFGCLRSLVTVDMSECTKVKEIGDRAFAGRIGTDSYASLQLFKIGTEVPPKFGYDVFHNGVRDYAVLKVPSGCIDAYKAAAGCYIFASITELDE